MTSYNREAVTYIQENAVNYAASLTGSVLQFAVAFGLLLYMLRTFICSHSAEMRPLKHLQIVIILLLSSTLFKVVPNMILSMQFSETPRSVITLMLRVNRYLEWMSIIPLFFGSLLYLKFEPELRKKLGQPLCSGGLKHNAAMIRRQVGMVTVAAVIGFAVTFGKIVG